MKKLALSFAVLLLLVPFAVMADGHEYEAWACPEGYQGQTLSIFNWSTYIAEDTIPNFEAACGVTVNYDIYESNEDMLARIRQGNPGYDLVVPSGDTVQRMSEEGLLVPLDMEMIPNVAQFTARPAGPSIRPGQCLVAALSMGHDWHRLQHGSLPRWTQILARSLGL